MSDESQTSKKPSPIETPKRGPGRPPKPKPLENQPKRDSGRQPLQTSLDVINTACTFNATKDQVIGALCVAGFKMSHSTLDRIIKTEYDLSFDDFRDKKTADTKLTLIQKAIGMALAGNPTMLIFCLKNLCDWGDRPREDDDEKRYRQMPINDLIALVRGRLMDHVPEAAPVQLEEAK